MSRAGEKVGGDKSPYLASQQACNNLRSQTEVCDDPDDNGRSDCSSAALGSIRGFEILRYADGAFAWEKDLVVEERRVEILVNGKPYVSVMATPAQLDSLAIGYLFMEGVINDISEVGDISVDGLRVFTKIRKNLGTPPTRARSSGFGLGSVAIRDIQKVGGDKGPYIASHQTCNNLRSQTETRDDPDDDCRPARPPAALDPIRGKDNFDGLRPEPPIIAAKLITTLMEEFNQLSELFWKTGAVHSSWLVRGELRYFAEDVGRHNALDKVIGQYLADGQPSSDQAGLIFTTGRISIEMLLKTARAGMTALISRGAASRLAVEFAERLNVVLIGFARGDQFKAFHGGQYISAPDQ